LNFDKLLIIAQNETAQTKKSLEIVFAYIKYRDISAGIKLKHMKKFTIVLSVICLMLLKSSMAQFTDNIKFGVKGSYLESAITTQEGEWQDLAPGFGIGIFAQYDIMDILGVSIEPSFARKGINNFDPTLIYFEGSPKLDFDFKDQKLKLNIIQVPILAQLNLDMGMNVRVFGGPSFDFITKATHYTLRDETGIAEDFTFEMESVAEVTERFVYVDYTAIIGVGFDMEVNPIDLRIDIFYQHGFSDLSVVENKPALYTRTFGVTVGVGLNKLVF
jgi:hypothetical protein